MIASVTICAQTEGFSGFFRLANPGYGDVINAVNHYDFNCVSPTTDNAGSITSIETEKMYSAIDDIAELPRKYDEGLITGDQHELSYQVKNLNYSLVHNFSFI